MRYAILKHADTRVQVERPSSFLRCTPVSMPLQKLAFQKRTHQRNVVTAFGGYSGGAGFDAPSIAGLVGQVTTALAWAGVAFMGYKLVLPQDASESNRKECATCGGTGLVECFCTRWSDGDSSGCGTCGGTRKMTCSSCSGGGTAVPIVAKVYIQPEKDYMNR